MNNAELLGNISDLTLPRAVSGVGGSITIYQQGFLPIIGRVLYCPDFMVRAISVSRVVKNERLDLDYSKQKDEYSITDVATGVSLKFRPSYGLYACNFPSADGLPRNDRPPACTETILLDGSDQGEV